MRTLALAAAVACAASAAAAGSPEPALQAQLGVLKAQIRQLQVSTDAPELAGQLSSFESSLTAFVAQAPQKKDQAEALARRTRQLRDEAAAARRSEIGNGSIDAPSLNPRDYEKHAGQDFCQKAAGALRDIVADGEKLLQEGGEGVKKGDREVSSRAPGEDRGQPAEGRFRRAAEVVNGLNGTIARKGALEFDGLRDVVAPLPVAAPLPRARPALEPGATGDAVREAQRAYNASRQPGQPRLKDDGVLGRRTLKALADFQTSRRVGDGSGRVDWATQRALAAAADDAKASRIVPGDPRKDAVKLLQDQLGRVPGLGFVPRDGVFGPGLEAKLKRFQKSKGLPVTGQADEATWLKISELASGHEPAKLLPENEVWYSRKITPSLADKIAAAARKEGVSPAEMQSFVWTEGGATAGRSRAGAAGAAQITRPTAKTYCSDLGWKRVSGTVDGNLECAARIYHDLYNKTGGNPVLALAAYNAGPKYLGRVPAIKETVAYVVRNSRYHCELTGQRLLDPAQLPPSMLAYARKADGIVAKWISDEGRTPNPSCSPF